jgi:hypothetical protein
MKRLTNDRIAVLQIPTGKRRGVGAGSVRLSGLSTVSLAHIFYGFTNSDSSMIVFE